MSLLAIGMTSSVIAYADPARLATKEALKGVVLGHYYAIGENRLEQAVHYFHRLSPDRSRIRGDIKLGQSAYVQRTTTLKFEVTGGDQEYAYAKATHYVLRIVEIKFIEEIAQVQYMFRKEDDVWKLWTVRVVRQEPMARVM